MPGRGKDVQDSLLLVEDTESLSMLYGQALERAGHTVTRTFTMSDARDYLIRCKPRLVLLDLQLPDGDGIELLETLQANAPDIRVIVITANGSIYRAVQAMRAGAFDFLVKPFDDARLVNAVQNALASAPHQSDSAALEVDTDSGGFEGFIGHSKPMTDIYRMIKSIGRSTATVFITGESGTGKDVAARAIHSLSNRAHKPFVPLNCAAIPRDLLESEVFGHLKGAFTGALSDKPGAAAVANGGTLFLDEVCEMDLSLQTKLLRFLQTSTIQPVGAARPVPVDVRIVCATNRNPLDEVRAGRFREDLYYRLHVVPIHMPPLQGRGQDILDIAQSFLVEYAREEGKGFTGFDREVAQILINHPWPGNVRQLLNVVRNVMVLHDGPLVTPEMLPSELAASRQFSEDEAARNRSDGKVQQFRPSWVASADRVPVTGRMADLVGLPLSDVEREFIEATITHCGGSIPRAAKVLGVSPSTIYRKLDSWNSSVERSA